MQTDDTASFDESPVPPPDEAGTTPADAEPTLTEEGADIPSERLVPEALHSDEEGGDSTDAEGIVCTLLAMLALSSMLYQGGKVASSLACFLLFVWR